MEDARLPTSNVEGIGAGTHSSGDPFQEEASSQPENPFEESNPQDDPFQDEGPSQQENPFEHDGKGSVETLPIATRRISASGPPVVVEGSPATALAAPDANAGSRTDAAPSAVAAKVPLHKRRWFIITSVVGALLGIAFLFILLYPIVHAIAQHIVDVSVLNLDQAAILHTTNTSFALQMDGWVSHTGIFSASIKFPQPLNISWIDGDNEIPIGSFPLQTLSAKHKRAYINQTTQFTIFDEDAFSNFTSAMITRQNFTWRLQSDQLQVQAVKFPVAKGIKFKKDLVLNGEYEQFRRNVILQDFQLPSDSPEGGINFVAVTGLNNPSPFEVDLGTVVFNLLYQNVFLGSGTGTNTTLTRGSNTIALVGRLVPHNDSQSDLAVVSQLFTQYLNGETSPVVATGQSTLQNDNSSISWLSAGLQALQLAVPFKAPGAISPIKSITIGDMALAFSQEQPWSPMANSRTVQASMQLPFGFGLSIGQIENEFNITRNGSVAAGLSTPLGMSTSEIKVINSTSTEGTIDIVIENTALQVPDSSHPHFSQFNADLTDLLRSDFQLVGYARAIASTSIGNITLDPIMVNVPSGLDGLRGLKGLVSIDSVDVLGGTNEAISLGINVTISNPSNLRLETGDLTFQRERGNGATLLPNLTLQLGNNSIAAIGNFTPNMTPEGLKTLSDFVGGSNVQVQIAGYGNSTEVISLLEAFETLDLNVVLPGLATKLLSSASLEVLDTTGHENNTAHVTVSLENPFTAGLQITQINSTVSFRGITLGTIQTPTNFTSMGKSVSSSPTLDLDMNMDPQSLFTVTRVLAQEAGLDTQQLDGIVQLGGYHYLNTDGSGSSLSQRDNIYTGFNLPNFVDEAFKQLRSDVELIAAVSIGDYQTSLQYTQDSVVTTTDKSLNLLLPILAQPIVQKVVTGSILGVSNVLIKDIKEQSFGTKLTGSITQSGPFDAVISFGSGLSIFWSGKPLGSIQMPDVNISGDVGADFEVLLTEESFDWAISGENLSVSALGIVIPGIQLPSKNITLKGMNGLKDGVTIHSFDLPSNDPEGGIHLTLNTSVTNVRLFLLLRIVSILTLAVQPSQVGVQLTSIGFQSYFGDTNIGPVASNSGVVLASGSTTSLYLAGRLVPQTSAAGLQAISTVFNNFIHGLDSNVSVQGDSAGPTDVTWLNEGIKSLEVSTVLPNQGALNIIKSIDLNELDLRFSTDTAYDPSTSSNDATAAFTLPFDFPIDITALEQNITIGTDGQSFAQLIVPKGPSTTDVKERIIHLAFSNVPFAVFDNQHTAFQQFLASTAASANQTMQLSGAANADANTAVGLISLTDITFSVSTSIAGLQGLNTKPTMVSALDVNHGFPDYLLIKATTSLFNPSNLTLGAGDVDFGLFFQNQQIGTADISNILIIPGNDSYAIDVHYSPQGSAVSAGQALLENYLQGVQSDTTIQGSQETTPIDSLKLAMSEIRLSPVSIPALHQNLITSASLVFPTDIAQTGMATASFVLDNPFTASINLLEVTANTTFQNLSLGLIDHQLLFKFNLDPMTIIELLLAGANNNHVNLGPLTDLFNVVLQNPNDHPPTVYQINTSVDPSKPTCVSGTQFDVNDAILGALKNLEVQLDVNSAVKIDDFATDLAFKQFNVKAITDETALYLIGAVAPPIVQDLVDAATLTFSEANITNISDDGFDLSLRGSLTGTGPLDAEIAFVDPVTVTWNGNDIAEIALPPAANSGVPNYETNARLTITDADRFTSFATVLLHNGDFDWTISTSSLRVTALGTIFDGVSLSKNISFKAFNNLPGVTISNFQLPSDDPAGGIHIETDSLIPSPSNLGIDLGNVGFQAFVNDTLVGPLSGSNLFLAPMAQTKLHLSGRMIPQTGDGLDTMGVLFSEFLAGHNQTLSVHGDSVQPTGSNQSVSWLSAAFKTLTLQVTLPGETFTVIESIAISDLEVTIVDQNEVFAPLASSRYTLAQYKNPFGFALQVVQSSEDITLGAGGIGVAQLKLPMSSTMGGVSTGNLADLLISFNNQTLQSLNDGAFAAFLAQVTDTESVAFDLQGTADVVARTSIGDVSISGIPFNVNSSLKGIDSFTGSAALTNVTITGSGSDNGGEFIKAPLTTMLENPSNISLQTISIALPVYYKDVLLGRAAIDTLNLVPGENVVATEFHYAPNDANDTTAQSFLTDFLQTGDTLPLQIKGDVSSSPFGSLQSALEGVELTTSLQGLNVPPIVTHINAFITLDSLLDNLISINFDVSNPLDTDMTISFAQVDSGVNGEIFAHLDQAFDTFTIPAKGTANSGTFGNVLLTQGALASLPIIPLQKLDVFAAATVQIGGYTMPWLHLTQLGVPTSYQLSLSISAMKQKAQMISASKAGSQSQSPSSTVPPLGIHNSSAPTTSSQSVTPSDSGSPGPPHSSDPSTTSSPLTDGGQTGLLKVLHVELMAGRN
ncbi:hypothetical protein A0H81_06855 [Grifola frondosa]|uniref:Uncharacterized protein n=1 Tax=Grifola frondosa TaxID=5627 RepID=A0A1C7M8S9_GRIFR|nr:hypothetical protein A0H81_06855 [Grifola frondosa]